MLSFIEVTLILADVTLKAMHSASKHDSSHMCELLYAACEPLYSKCSADKSLTSIFYSWGPSRPGYHFCNSPCANTSCSVSPVLLRPWEMSTKVILSPPPLLLRHLSWLFILLSQMVCLCSQVEMRLRRCFLKKFSINSAVNKKLSGRRHGGKQTVPRYLRRGETPPRVEKSRSNMVPVSPGPNHLAAWEWWVY